MWKRATRSPCSLTAARTARSDGGCTASTSPCPIPPTRRSPPGSARPRPTSSPILKRRKTAIRWLPPRPGRSWAIPTKRTSARIPSSRRSNGRATTSCLPPPAISAAPRSASATGPIRSSARSGRSRSNPGSSAATAMSHGKAASPTCALMNSAAETAVGSQGAKPLPTPSMSTGPRSGPQATTGSPSPTPQTTVRPTTPISSIRTCPPTCTSHRATAWNFSPP